MTIVPPDPATTVTATGRPGLATGAAALTVGAAGLGVAALDRALGGLGNVPRLMDTAIGAAATAAGVGVAGVRVAANLAEPLVELAARPPLVPAALQPGTYWDRWSDRGWRIRRDAEFSLGDLLDTTIPQVAEGLISRLDLTGIVLRNVDLDRILQAVDLPRVAEYIVDEIDLPAIIRDSTSSVTTEAVRGVRMQSVDADQAVARLVDRLVRRRRRDTDADGEGFDEPTITSGISGDVVVP